ncbi:MAG: type I-E CRISPR-associated protein Cas7/Cse4/CasC, partial [Cellvibrionaceae bacterium]|nr:type I-E CRISPR-associated protein Cas7/Cse4/CasC [Cellvibrionaceae bacterium]
KMGGVDRLRVSSQSLKRNWRTSDLFQSALSDKLGTRTKRLGIEIYKQLIDGDVKEKDALNWATEIAQQFGKLKKADKNHPLIELEIEQLVHISPSEQAAVNALAQTLVAEQRKPNKDELKILRSDEMAVDIALFGRMLASSPAFNVEAACQVAHAISVHPVVIEDDYFTAVDDLNDHSEDAGAAHIGETGFAAGLFYSYICINNDELIDNLNGDQALAKKAIAALTETAIKVAPTGKQNSFGSRAYASYVLAETGDQQPRSLSVSFLRPISNSQDYAGDAIAAIKTQRDNFDSVYGACADAHYEFDANSGNGSLKQLLAFVSE